MIYHRRDEPMVETLIKIVSLRSNFFAQLQAEGELENWDWHQDILELNQMIAETLGTG